MKITEIKNTKWRDDLLPASFRGAFFHVDTGTKESGRATVVHEFPKKDLPYPEDMGRRARLFNVRGYCIVYPTDVPAAQQNAALLYQRDYRDARDALIAALETDGPALLQLPTIRPILVVPMNYRWTEEQRLGGYCTFDMSFCEWGVPNQVKPSPDVDLLAESNKLKAQVQAVMKNVDQIVEQRKLQGLRLRPNPPLQQLPPTGAPG